MQYFNNLRPDFITMFLQNNLTTLQLFMIILNYVGKSDRSQHAQDVNAVLLNLMLIILPLWLTYKRYVISMQTATTGLICLRQFESAVFFPQIFYF